MEGKANSIAKTHNPDNVAELRRSIDRIDTAILELLAKRTSVARRIAGAKQQSGGAVYDEEREQALLSERLSVAESLRLDPGLVSGLWEQILTDSVRVQTESSHAGGSGTGLSEEATFANSPPTDSRTPNPYHLVTRDHRPADTTVAVGDVVFGGEELVVISGPCAVESFEQVMACARAARKAGSQMLRGGCFKPRTSPYSFQGLGWEGLDMLAEAGRAYGLPIVTEVPGPNHVEAVAEVSDVLQVGARNMQNFTLLQEVGRSTRPVLLKRGMSASIEELLQAAEYILSAGNENVILCERGIRTFETATRNTLDVSAVPVLRERTHLPVIVDPSHAAGDRGLVAPLALAAIAAGADGLMIEMHPKPDNALSDGPQSIRLEAFTDLMGDIGTLGRKRRRLPTH